MDAMIPEFLRQMISDGGDPGGLHPQDELAVIEGKLREKSPEDEEVGNLLRRRRRLNKQACIERLMKAVERAENGDDEGFRPQIGTMRPHKDTNDE